MSKIRVLGRTNLSTEQQRELEEEYGVFFFDTNVVEEGCSDIHTAIAERIADAEVIGVNMITPISRQTVDRCPSIRRILAHASGTNHIDLEYCQQKGIEVRSAYGYCSQIVAEKTICFIMIAMYQILPAIDNFKRGQWDYLNFQGRELFGKRLLVAGYGSIGRIVGQLGSSLGMLVEYVRSSTDADELGQMLRRADILSLNIPLTPDTENWLNRDRLRELKENIVVVNTSRGGVIDEAALFEFMQQHPSACAVLDVLNEEPPPLDHPVRTLSNVIVTPHIAWHSKEADERLAAFLYEELKKSCQEIAG